ncbi:restriction endonuclease subunit S, partial [uncultured Alistipes sp.]|uniref:restriction endonuclease subunit S n=1 Tax=uncultured Alistipes sp. TaxID=538949 RepID=UPI0025AF283F
MAANKNNKALNVPHLRFPGFTEEWRKYKLSEICSFFSGGTPSSSKKEYYDGSIPFIRSGELHEDQTELFITEDGLKNSAAKMVEVGDLLLALYGATSGDIAISKINGAINQAILCIRTEQHKKFIESIWYKHVGKLLQTYLQGGQGNLSADIVKNISFYFAAIEEQKKLAEFIALLDERIATQNKIIEKLETLIKALSATVFNSLQGPLILLSKVASIKKGQQLNGTELEECGRYYVMNGGVVPSGYYDEYNTEANTISISEGGNSCGYVQFNT